MRARNYAELMARPWAYNDPAPICDLERKLRDRFGVDSCLITANGRSALFTIFKALGASPGDEVIVQAFTCVAAVNPILWAGFTPVFVDIDPSNLGPSLNSIAERITPKTRAILVQHTFGMAADVQRIVKLAAGAGAIVVEDCAHCLGVSAGGTPLGTFGDVAMLSFGIDKQLSSKTGGAVLTRNGQLADAIRQEWTKLPRMPQAETARWLLYPLLRIVLRRIPQPRGTEVARWLERAAILRQAITELELHGAYPPSTPGQLSGALAAVVADELDRLDGNLAHRAEMTDLYRRLLPCDAIEMPIGARGPLLRFPILCADVPTRNKLRNRLRMEAFDVTTWYDPPVYPMGVDPARINYKPYTVPVAEAVAKRILCLPTGRNINSSGVESIARILLAD